MAPALTFALQALSLLPSLIQAGAEIVSIIQSTTTALHAMHAEDRDPTDTEWATLTAASEAALARLGDAST